MASDESFHFTKEQRTIISSCPRHQEGRKRGIVFRVTAAAGSGKTTTLLGLAKEAIQRNHKSLTYCTFTKAAANDGRHRILKECGAVDLSQVRLEARTIHSLAALVLNENEEDGNASNNFLYDENRFKKWLNKTLEREIDEFLEPCASFWSSRGVSPREHKSRLHRARDQVQHFIYKNFVVNFCQSSRSLENFRERQSWNRIYYPVKKFYDEGKAQKYGLHRNRKDHFFADMAVLAWEKALEENIATHDIRMKRAQLENCEIPGSIILVDESQDMDACQVAFCVQNQVNYGKVVYVVGDPAQTIFGFRGAKAKNLMNMKVNRSFPLHQSWRFGPVIAKVANTVLYAKEYSPQTKQDRDGRNLYWDPYRICAGRKSLEGVVTDQPIVKKWKSYENEPVTIIARANATLMMEALDVLGFEFPEEDEEGEETNHLGSYHNNIDEELLNGTNVPKIHLFGKGEGSGAKGWKQVMKMVAEVYHLYEISKEQPDAAMKLSSAFHPEFYDRRVTWNEYTEDCRDKELTKYTRVNHIVFKYKKNTMKAVDAFEEHVMNKEVPESEADIIFTTCHSAKGMEWPYVQVCDDFMDPCEYEEEGNQNHSPDDCSARKKWRFKFKAYDNDVNMLYVACTRAKKTLSLPQKLCNLLWEFDRVTAFVRNCPNVVTQPQQQQEEGVGGMHLGLKNISLNVAQARRFHQHLVEPLRREMKLESDEKLVDSILTVAEKSLDGVATDKARVSPSVVSPDDSQRRLYVLERASPTTFLGKRTRLEFPTGTRKRR